MAERFDRVSGLLELIRWQGRGVRGDPSAIRGLLDSCYVAVEVGIPDDFTSVGLCVLETAAEKIGASSASVRADFTELFAYQRAVEAANRDELEQVRAVHPRLARHMGPPCVLRHQRASPICTEGEHFCGVSVWLRFPDVVRPL